RADGGRACDIPILSNSSGPSPTVTVSLAGRWASSGSVSASAGRPWVSRSASAVHSLSTAVSACRGLRPLSARRSSAVNSACACGGVWIPAWWTPWNGTTSAPNVVSGATVPAPARPTDQAAPAAPIAADPPARSRRRLIVMSRAVSARSPMAVGLVVPVIPVIPVIPVVVDPVIPVIVGPVGAVLLIGSREVPNLDRERQRRTVVERHLDVDVAADGQRLGQVDEHQMVATRGQFVA